MTLFASSSDSDGPLRPRETLPSKPYFLSHAVLAARLCSGIGIHIGPLGTPSRTGSVISFNGTIRIYRLETYMDMQEALV
jgi:hypothetical protein